MRTRSVFSLSNIWPSSIVLACTLAACSTSWAQSTASDKQSVNPVFSSASFERLVQLTQKLDHDQQILLNLEKLQLYELRLQRQEAREDVLSERERNLSAKNAQFEKSLQATDAGVSPTGVPQMEAHSSLQSHLSDQSATTSRLLDSVRTEKAQVEHNIEKLRARIAALEKQMGDDAP